MDTRIRNRHPSPRGSTRRKRKPPKHFRKTAQIPDTPPAWTLSRWQVSWLTGRNLKTPSRSVCFFASTVQNHYDFISMRQTSGSLFSGSPFTVAGAATNEDNSLSCSLFIQPENPARNHPSLLSGAARFESMGDVSIGQSVSLRDKVIVPLELKMRKSNQSFN
ncbi:hypothetical protein M2418_001383 [Rhizobium sp. BIGb0125]|nr:hypothetical protein [Rhizobium sp. BIGb0125]